MPFHLCVVGGTAEQFLPVRLDRYLPIQMLALCRQSLC